MSRETEISAVYNSIKQRLIYCRGRITRQRYPFLTRSISFQLGMARERFDRVPYGEDLHELEKFQNIMDNYDYIGKQLSHIEQRLDRIENTAHLVGFAVRFVKKNIIFQSANLVIALILFPITTHYLNFVIPDLNLSAKSIWIYQKIVIILGGFSALILASLTSKKDAHR